MPDLSPQNPAILIMDGHGSHFTLELLEHCREVGLHILLRPPHTTHVLQGEDVVHFGIFKPKYQAEKLRALSAAVLAGRTSLTARDLLSCARGPWEEAFNQRNCLSAWEKTGIAPFTRRVYWELLEKEQHREALATAQGIDPARVEIEGMCRIMYPQVCPNPAGEEGPEAGGDGEQPPGHRRKKRKPVLNSSAFWDLPMGVTGNEATEMIKDLHETKQVKLRATLVKKARRLADKESRQRSNNELGASIWADLCTLECEVSALTVDKLKACLVYRAVPIPKGALKPALKALLEAEIDNYEGPELGSELDTGGSDVGEPSSAPVQSENEQYSEQSSSGDDSQSESDAS